MMGIIPGDFCTTDIKISFKLLSKEVDDLVEASSEKTFAQKIIINQHNKYHRAWDTFIKVASLLSSYFYAYMSACEIENETVLLLEIMAVFETIFFASMVSKFLVTYTREGTNIEEKDLSKISLRYFKSRFLIDLIALFPFPVVLDFNGIESHLYLIKIIRLKEGFELLDVSTFMEFLRKYY